MEDSPTYDQHSLEEPNDETIRVTDRRGQPKSSPAPESNGQQPQIDEDVAEQMAQQGLAADQEREAEKTMKVACYAVVALDASGGAHMYITPEELAHIKEYGIEADRPTGPVDVMNMSGQLVLMVQGNEVASRVFNMMQQQAAQMQQAMQQAQQAGLGGPLPVDPRVQRAARGRG